MPSPTHPRPYDHEVKRGRAAGHLGAEAALPGARPAGRPHSRARPIPRMPSSDGGPGTCVAHTQAAELSEASGNRPRAQRQPVAARGCRSARAHWPEEGKAGRGGRSRRRDRPPRRELGHGHHGKPSSTRARPLGPQVHGRDAGASRDLFERRRREAAVEWSSERPDAHGGVDGFSRGLHDEPAAAPARGRPAEIATSQGPHGTRPTRRVLKRFSAATESGLGNPQMKVSRAILFKFRTRTK